MTMVVMPMATEMGVSGSCGKKDSEHGDRDGKERFHGWTSLKAVQQSEPNVSPGRKTANEVPGRGLRGPQHAQQLQALEELHQIPHFLVAVLRVAGVLVLLKDVF